MERAEAADSPIDFERLREVSDDDAEMMNELIDLYFSQTGEQLDELENAVAAGNFDGIYKSAHKIAGGSLTCGMNAIVSPIRELEQIGRNQNGENAETLFVEAKNAFSQMKSYLELNREEMLH